MSARRASRLAGGLLALASVLNADWASANGRFPRAQRLLEHGGDDRRLLLAATYGLLSTTDRGASWWHICELSFGLVPAPADPLLEVSSAGMLAGLLNGVTLSRDDGCDFDVVLGDGSEETATDITVDKSEPARVLGLLKRTQGASVVSELQQSRDGGRSFERLAELPAGFDFPLTVDIAPSEPARVYVSGVTGGNVGQVLRSDDGGASWQPPFTLPGTSYVNAPFIAAVDPSRADLLFVRTDGRELDGERVWAKDSLFIGDMTGAEGCGAPGFCEALSVRAKLLGFALSPEGDRVLIGLGDPRDPAFEVDARFVGLYSGATADLLAAPAGGSFPPPGFERVHAAPVSCVSWTTHGIYVCTSQQQTGFALGFAADVASLERGELEPLLDLSAVQGPLACPSTTSTASCGADWRTTCEELGACGNELGEGGEGGAAGAGTAGQAGAVEPLGGSSGAPSRGPGGSAGSQAVGGGEPAPAAASSDEGCGCRFAGAPSQLRGFALLALLGLGARRRQRGAQRH